MDEPADISKLTVGIIKPKNVDMNDFLTPLIQDYVKASSLDFGNLRSSNTLEDCDILFVVGTYNVNIEGLQKAFKKLYHREPWSTEAVKLKLSDGGYRYDADPDLENYRRMVEDNEMYQAIHRVRPALRKKKVYVFGVIPEEIFDEFQVEDVTFEKEKIENVGVMCLVEWKSLEKFVMEKIGEEGIFQYELVNAVYEEFGGNKEVIRRKIKEFVEAHKEEYESVGKRTPKNQWGTYIRRR